MLEEGRKKINDLDAKMLDLLNRRAEIAEALGEEKEKLGESIEDREREEAILKRLKDINEGPLSGESVVNIFEVIFEEMKRVQKE